MKPFARGQRSRLDALTPSLELIVGLKVDAPGLSIDFVCFGLDESGQLSDDRFMVFYNQPAAPANAIVRENPSRGDDETMRVRLENLPQSIRRLVFTATVDGVGTMNQARAGYIRLADATGDVARYEFAGRDFAQEKALMVGEIYFKEVWRFTAVGQGFVGDLSALLKHFGGVEDTSAGAASTSAPPPARPSTSPPPRPAPPATPPAQAAPRPSPTTASVSAPPPGSSTLDQPSLQKLIDEAPIGGIVQLGRGEFAGPVTIRRAVTLQGAGGVIWARQGPVLTIDAANVALRDVNIEVTAPEEAAGGESDVAVLARQGTSPALSNLRVRGRVSGAGFDGAWKVPPCLDLETFAPRVANTWEFTVEAASTCELSCTVAGVALQPSQLAAGVQTVRMLARDVPAETFVCGEILLRCGEVVRAIPISGRTGGADTAPAQNKRL